MNLLTTISLIQEDFITPLVWLISFCIIFGLAGYIKRNKLYYLVSIIFFFILIIKTINHFFIFDDKTNLEIYKNNDLIILKVIAKGKVVENYSKNFYNIQNLRFEYLVEKVRGNSKTASGTKFEYNAITYIDSKNIKQEFLSTRDMFNGRFISKKNLEEIYKILLKENNK